MSDTQPPAIKTLADLAAVLNTTEQKLTYALYNQKIHTKYTTFSIGKKSGGTRSISKPNKLLMSLQKNLKCYLVKHYSRRPCSHGFEIDHGIKSNADSHKRPKIVLNVDLQDFFGSINFGRVYGLFSNAPFNFPKSTAAAAANIACFKNALPQGAPTSPIIANMICLKLDSKLMSLAQKHKCLYTRYVDDITFSSRIKTFDPAIGTLNEDHSAKVGKKLNHIITSEGFTLNPDKSRIRNQYVRQDVTGLTVNEFSNVNRSYINNVFGMIYAWKSHGIAGASAYFQIKYSHPKIYKASNLEELQILFRSVVIGRISHIAHIRGWDDIVVRKLCVKYCECDSKPPTKIGLIGNTPLEFKIFLGHASEQKESIVEPLHAELNKLNISSFKDSDQINWGDSLTKIINHALANSQYFLAIISADSINKNWPDKEMNAAISREIAGKQVIIPLFVGTDTDVEILKNHYPLIDDKLHMVWKNNAPALALEIATIIGKGNQP